MTGGPLFSVIVPTYGRSALLAEAVRSVLDQSLDDFECVVVDDAGPESPQLPDDPRLRLVRRPRNGGSAAARNTGLAQARGRFVVFLDDDDAMTPDRLRFAWEGLQRADVAVCHRGVLGGGSRTGERLEGDVHDVICDGFCPHLGQTALAREACLPFDTGYRGAEDVEWWIRTSRGLSVTTVAEVGYLVRSHPGVRHGNGVRARIDGSRQLLAEHRDYFTARPRAAAFRELRLGLLYLEVGERANARRALARSLRTRPQARTAWHLVRSLVPARTRAGGVPATAA